MLSIPLVDLSSECALCVKRNLPTVLASFALFFTGADIVSTCDTSYVAVQFHTMEGDILTVVCKPDGKRIFIQLKAL